MSERICRFNQSIICGHNENCGSCGWNPEEYERRVMMIRQAGTVFGSIRNPMRHIKGEENRTALRRFSGLRRG